MANIIEKRIDKKSATAIEQLLDISSDSGTASEKGASDNSTLLEALIYYFAQSQTSKATLRVIARDFKGETASYDQIAKAVQHSFENRNRIAPPRTALNKIMQLLQGANLISFHDEGYRASPLGEQLINEMEGKH